MQQTYRVCVAERIQCGQTYRAYDVPSEVLLGIVLLRSQYLLEKEKCTFFLGGKNIRSTIKVKYGQ